MSEYTEVEQPFLQQLQTLGWEIIDQGPDIPTDPGKSLRLNFRQWILPELFARSVAALNMTAEGQPWLTDKQLQDLHDQILRRPNRTLLEANEAIQKLLFKAQVDVNEVSGEQDPVVKLIDFANPQNNHFLAINQFRIDTPGGVKQFIIPDIVLFMNGIPLIVVECKKGGPNCANPMDEAFEQLRRYMNQRKATHQQGLKEGEPRLFHCNLLLIRTTGVEADYGTITSGDEHFYPWKTQWPRPDTVAEGMNQQQQLINGMLGKVNLLSILRTSSVFMDTDSGPRIKVVCRYQQFRAANKIVERLRNGQTAEEKSGVVWHTQGSGKSLTMVFVARMLRASRDQNDYKILLINDRVDLEGQLAATATLIGGRVHTIDSRKALRGQLATDSSDINMVMVHKFQLHDQSLPLKVAEALGTYQAIPTSQTFGVVNDSSRIVLMIDEAHRTQGSDLGDNIFEAFPNAARIAFTGTPLITERHGEKKTYKRFGGYIDTYRLMDAVEDGTTLQILYEGRTADAALNDKHGFETQFENLFRDRSDEELLAIKKKYGATGDLLEAEQRIAAIARDLVRHYLAQIFPNGFKAQVVCHSKLAAVRYQQAIHAALAEVIAEEEDKAAPDGAYIDQLKFLKAAVVISGDGTKVVHEAVKLLKDEQIRADFDVYLKKFLMSMDIILPHQAAHPYRVPARRLGYIQRVARERYKDDTLNLGDAGQKVRDLINEHLISLSVNPKVPPVELLSEDFVERLNQHAEGNAEAKASEMEHAIRKHCTVRHDEDPAFYKSLSEKVEHLIDQYQDQWDLLAEELEKLRGEAIEGRKQGEEGMSREATTFYEHIANEAFEKGEVPQAARSKMKVLMETIVETLQESIGSIDFWNNSDKQKKTRSEIKKALTLTGITELKSNRERIAIEIMKLAKNRHDELLKGLGGGDR